MFFAKLIPQLLVPLAGFITFACASPTAVTPSVTRPSPEAQPAPTSIAALLALIRGDASGAQFRFVNSQNDVLDVAHFITSDNAPLFSAQNNPSGINSAFTFDVISPGTPFLVEIKDVSSGSFISYGLASTTTGTGTYEHSQPTLNKEIPTVFEIASVGGTGFTIQETTSQTFLTVWPTGVFPTFSPVTYELFDGTSNVFTQTWSFQPLQ